MSNFGETISNATFVERWSKGESKKGILIVEAVMINDRLLSIDSLFKRIIEEKKAVSGGDDWHDGAFRATDAEANKLATQRDELGEKLKLPHVELPTADSPVVSIGSRALIEQNGKFSYGIDFVGHSLLHKEDEEEEIELSTTSSPIGQRLIGLEIGEEAVFNINGKEQHFKVLATEPSPRFTKQEKED